MKVDVEILEEVLESLDFVKVDTDLVKEAVSQYGGHSMIDSDLEAPIMNTIKEDQKECDISFVDTIELIFWKYSKIAYGLLKE